MGFGTADQLRAAIAERPHIFHKSFIEKAADNIENLEKRVAEHIRLNATSSAALADAAEEIDRLTEENALLESKRDAVTRERDALARRVNELEGMVSSRVPPTTGLLTPATGKRRYVLLYLQCTYTLTFCQHTITLRIHSGCRSCDIALPADGALHGRGIRPVGLARGAERSACAVRTVAQGEGPRGTEVPCGLRQVARIQALDV